MAVHMKAEMQSREHGREARGKCGLLVGIQLLSLKI